MWKLFTRSAKNVVLSSQKEALGLGDGYVSTEHVLLGLLRHPDCMALQVLGRMQISSEWLESKVAEKAWKGEPIECAELTLTPRVKRVVDLAHDEAQKLGNNYIGTEHLLLGLVRERDGLAGRILANAGVNIDNARSFTRVIQDELGDMEHGQTEPSE
ncbi:MAG TPA: Clp protease N-terminal domain-containing protein [Fimbriimonadaceae bacterium]